MIGNKYRKYYHIIKKDKECFESILDKIKCCTSIEKKLELADIALNYAVSYNTGYYVSAVIEKVYTDYAKTIHIDLQEIGYQENSFLHVLTEGYQTGGHTRVIERWIENAPAEQKHSVVIVKPNVSPLEELKKLTQQKNGEFIKYDNNWSIKEKALKLRRLGMHYQYIILHTHMNDSTATIAFGTEEFTRPVLFYNHASHLFWIGKSITDLHIDLKKKDIVTEEYKNIKNKFNLGIPTKNLEFKTINKKEFRKQFGFPVDKKIIITAGSDTKYRPIGNDGFIDVLLNLVDDNTYVYAIGAEKNSTLWKNAYKASNGHIIALGCIDFSHDYLKYIGIADLYLDSYPMNGWTATIDAVTMNVPVLSLESILQQLDYLTATNSCCYTKKEIIEKARIVLTNQNYAENLNSELKKSLIQQHSKEAWDNKISKLLELTPNKHKVLDLSNDTDGNYINDLAVINNLHITNNETFMFNKKDIDIYLKYGMIYKYRGIRHVFDILSLKKHGIKTKIVKLFGIEIYKRTRG